MAKNWSVQIQLYEGEYIMVLPVDRRFSYNHNSNDSNYSTVMVIMVMWL